MCCCWHRTVSATACSGRLAQPGPGERQLGGYAVEYQTGARKLHVSCGIPHFYLTNVKYALPAMAIGLALDVTENLISPV